MSIEKLSQNILDLHEKAEALGHLHLLLQHHKGKNVCINAKDNTVSSELADQIKGQPVEAALCAVAHCLEEITHLYERHDIESLIEDVDRLTEMEINPQDFIDMD